MVKWIQDHRGELPAGITVVVHYYNVTPPDPGASRHVITEVQYTESGVAQIRYYDGGTPAIPNSNIGDRDGVISDAVLRDYTTTRHKLTERPGSPFTP